ncbi:MAG: hypothetical protein IKF22_05740 [Lachnospiraceae bacterium]|nr:hypothetical protein [Lachnospiraceae bacterium]
MEIFIWWLTITLLGTGFMPLSAWVFRHFDDRGWLFSKSLGIFLTAWVFFVLNTAHIVSFIQRNCLIVTGLLIALNILAFFKLDMREIFRGVDLKLIAVEEAMFFVVFAVWVYIIGFKPEAYGTEKFMDYAFMTSMTRSLYMPFEDMWFSGESINYYYGGQYIAAWLVKASGIGVGVGYNIMRATVAAFSFVMPFSLCYQLISDRLQDGRKWARWAAGLIGGWAVAFCGNVHYILYGIIKELTNSDYSYWFPDSTRYIGYDPDLPDKTIHEFPAYSTVLGDLHAHYINVMFVVCVTAIAYACVQKIAREIEAKKETLAVSAAEVASKEMSAQAAEGTAKSTSAPSAESAAKLPAVKADWKVLLAEILRPEIILIGIFTGVFKFTNYWDFPIYFVVCGSLIFFMNLRKYRDDLTGFAIVMGGQAACAFLIGTVACLPFTLTFDQISTEIGFTHTHTVFYQFMVLWGLPIICTLFYVICLLIEQGRLPSAKKAVDDTESSSGKKAEKAGKPIAYPDLAALLLALCALGLIYMPEVIFVKDIYSGEHYRANTMFKLTYQAFILFGMVMPYVIIRTLTVVKKLWAQVVSMVLCFILLMTGGFIVRSSKDWFGNIMDRSLRVSTDASVFVDQSFPSDFEAIAWLNNTVSGRPVVLEAPGDSYTGYERVSVATGLPTVRGWYVHEWLWRSDTDLLNERSADIETIYTGEDEQTVRDLIKKYNISYIYIGSLERSMYANINDTLLQSIGTVAYSDGVSTYILKVAG